MRTIIPQIYFCLVRTLIPQNIIWLPRHSEDDYPSHHSLNREEDVISLPNTAVTPF